MYNDVEIKEYSEEGFKPLVVFDAWRVALLNHSEKFSKITYLERHMETDEVFVLLAGTATLYIGEEMQPYPMEQGKIYNVKKASWHQIIVSTDAKVLVVENSDTTKDNSEYIYFA